MAMTPSLQAVLVAGTTSISKTETSLLGRAVSCWLIGASCSVNLSKASQHYSSGSAGSVLHVILCASVP